MSNPQIIKVRSPSKPKVIRVGFPGPAGPRGLTGPPGLSGLVPFIVVSDSNLTTLQNIIDDLWTAGGGVVSLAGRTFEPDGVTIDAKQNVVIRMDGATIIPRADVDVFRLRRGAKLWGPGNVDVSDVPGGYGLVPSDHISSVVYLSGDDNAGRGITMVRDISILNAPGGVSAYTGKAIYLETLAAGKSISYAHISDIAITGFEHGLHLYCLGGFINGNVFRYFDTSHCVYHVDIDDQRPLPLAPAENGSKFDGFKIQPRAAGDARDLRALRCRGRGNSFPSWFVWDWQTAADPNVALEFSERAIRNIGDFGGVDTTRMIDRGSIDIGTANIVILHNRTANVQQRIMIPPHNAAFPRQIGNQNDLLAWATHNPNWTVTQTGGSAPVLGSLADMFDLNPSTGPRWDATSTFPIEITGETTAPLFNLMFQTLHFSDGEQASNVKLEIYYDPVADPPVAPEWITILDDDGNTSSEVNVTEQPVIQHISRWRLTVSGLPVTIVDDLPVIGTIRIARLSAVAGSQAGNAYVGRDGGAVHGQLDLAGGVTIGGGGAVTKIITATATIDFPSINPGGQNAQTISVPGVLPNDIIAMSRPTNKPTFITYEHEISGADSLTVQCFNQGTSTLDPASAIFKYVILRI